VLEEFSWSVQLQCPLEFDATSEWVHLPDLFDKVAYMPLCIQRFEAFKLENKQQMAYEIFKARTLVRPLEEPTRAHNPWVPMRDETPEWLLAGCLHQIFLLRQRPRGHHTFSTYYFRKMKPVSLITDVFQAVFGSGTSVVEEAPLLFRLQSAIPNKETIKYRANVESDDTQISVSFYTH
jgi:hypothetical protein